MQVDTIYRAILEQAWRPEAARFTAGEAGFTEMAEAMSDDLYRLCVEFGVGFNEFKLRVLDEVLNRSQTRTGSKSDETPRPESMVSPAAANLPMLVFALELMREDGNELD